MTDSEKYSKGVLIVEDNVTDARNLKVIVQNLGYKICGIAPSGMSALDLMKQVNCETSLVLLNMSLKGPIDGIETAERIFTKYKASFVFLSSSADDEHESRFLNSTHPFAVVNKPFSLGLMESTIRDAFETSVGIKYEPVIPPNKMEKRKSSRIKALEFPFETAYINVDGQQVQVMLQNISLNGLGVLSEVALKKNISYPIRIVLSPPSGTVNATCTVCSIFVKEGYIYHGLKVKPIEIDRDAWEGYIRYRNSLSF